MPQNSNDSTDAVTISSGSGGCSTHDYDIHDPERSNTSQSMIEPDGLCRPGIGTRSRLLAPSSDEPDHFRKIEHAAQVILQAVGEDPNRPGLLETPKRFAKAMMDLTEGYGLNVWNIVNGAIFDDVEHQGIVVVKDIDISSLCEHHLVPFTGKMHIGYVPNGRVIGLSKLPRIAKMFSRRLQVQERLTEQVADTIKEVLEPCGVAVVMESSHLCMVTRGVQQYSASTVTSCMLGCFQDNAKTRSEFLSHVGKGSG